jgi:glycosyltransferase involved in cell wall biosynthesis
VISQSFKDYEYIIIDGSSTDGSIDVIKEYHKHISYWISERDNGVYNAMNKGIRQAKGDYLNFMNSGDVFYDKNVLATVAAELDDADIIVGKDYHYSEERQQGFSSILPSRVSMVTFFMETLPHQGAFISRRLFDDAGYDEAYKICADWVFYVRKVVVENRRVKLIPTIVSQREPGGMSNMQTEQLKFERSRLLHELLPAGVFHDYQTLSNIDRLSLYRLMNICENKKAAKILVYCIKVINRLFLHPQII